MVKNQLKTLSERSSGLSNDEIENPELIFGIVGPIGVNLDIVITSLCDELTKLRYSCETIHLTDHMQTRSISVVIDDSSYYKRYVSRIKYANRYRELCEDSAALAGISILEIKERRRQALRAIKNLAVPALGRAYIIRQFKRPEEIELMRKVYGRKFIQISVFSSEHHRRLNLINKIQSYTSSNIKDAVAETQAIQLIDMDHDQSDQPYGQRVSDVFHLGDVFVEGHELSSVRQTMARFVRAFFGDNKISPNKDEYGLYAATAAALRSIDLSRQVGAAIFSKKGEVISLGCNEVPKAFGGTYWCDEPNTTYRDADIGKDANQIRRNEIVYDLLNRMNKKSYLSPRLSKLRSVEKILEAFTADETIKESQVMDIIEFGRMIHAEMSALLDAARIGRPTASSTLFCTTFPCHICAKHIVAAGIDRVVFLEPYPKSQALKLHSDSISFSREDKDKVLFEPFIGISPRRYRDIFEKKKRKDQTGAVSEWYEGRPIPRIEDKSSAYIANEDGAIFKALGKLRHRRTSRPRRH